MHNTQIREMGMILRENSLIQWRSETVNQAEGGGGGCLREKKHEISGKI